MRPGPLQVIIGDPIPVAGYTRRDLDALAERTQAAVAELLRSAEPKRQLALGS